MEFKDLTPEKQGKVKACKTPEEVHAFAFISSFIASKSMFVLSRGAPDADAL